MCFDWETPDCPINFFNSNAILILISDLGEPRIRMFDDVVRAPIHHFLATSCASSEIWLIIVDIAFRIMVSMSGIPLFRMLEMAVIFGHCESGDLSSQSIVDVATWFVPSFSVFVTGFTTAHISLNQNDCIRKNQLFLIESFIVHV